MTPQNDKPTSKLKPADWGIVVLMMAGSFYLMFTYGGPFRWVSELQLRWLGAYYEKLSFLLTCGILAIPLFGTKALIAKLRPPEARPPMDGQAEASDSADVAQQPATKKRAFFNFGILLGLLLAGLGGFMWWRGATAGTLTRVTVSELEQGVRPASRYLEIEGVALWEAAPGIEGRDVKYYVPVTAPDWAPPKPVVVFLDVDKDEYEKHEAVERGAFRGLVNIEKLPGMLRDRLQESELRPAEGYLILDFKNRPETLTNSGRQLAGIGAAAFAAGVVYAMIRQVRSRRPLIAADAD